MRICMKEMGSASQPRETFDRSCFEPPTSHLPPPHVFGSGQEPCPSKASSRFFFCFGCLPAEGRDTMKTFLPDNFVLQKVTRNDIVIASVAWGFTLGIGWLTTWTAMQQTRGVIRRRGWAVLWNPYVIMIWLEIAVCLSFGIICFMHLMGVIPPRYGPCDTHLVDKMLTVGQLCVLLLHP